MQGMRERYRDLIARTSDRMTLGKNCLGRLCTWLVVDTMKLAIRGLTHLPD